MSCPSLLLINDLLNYSDGHALFGGDEHLLYSCGVNQGIKMVLGHKPACFGPWAVKLVGCL